MFILQLALILFVSKIAGDISVRLGQPSVVGKLVAGIVIGPSVLGLVHDSELLSEMSRIGVILLMFLAGLETDLDEFKKSAKSSILVGSVGVAFPLVFGALAGRLLGLDWLGAAFLGLLLSATSVSISVQTLKELGKLKSKEGMVVLGAAVIDDVLVMVALAFLMSLAGGDTNLGIVLLKKAVFFFIAIFAAWKVVPWLLGKLPYLKVTEPLLSGSFIICFLFAYFSETAGVAAIIGAYITGIAISTTKYQEKVFHKTETVSYSIFVPVFFTSIGIQTELEGTGPFLGMMAILIIVAVLTKIAGGGLGARWAKFSWEDSLGIGSAMVSRGEVALIIAGIGLEEKLLSGDWFTVLVMVVLVTTIVTPVMMKFFFRGKQEAVSVEDLKKSDVQADAYTGFPPNNIDKNK
ncbi:Na+/H+ antiporter GerT [Weizmannia acidilactici]|uniref:Na+/H+ antiporter GerT n=1 Tax=Weizmannia acidilactici TaxID=2607726 RepID=A0A5J4J1S7_9BACI|nr:cation:proton antiporter [Weizmannia acidilactici]GER66625.1 Na+/H+ antiporter GerT [Weizmannia acidilactici]GER68896.1 Na+/H+ antiporter GerT [Weizmannia acidilactici]GER73524.1 Na+/H+ antiporter GerT [Weizmannia acidilactici]